VNSDDDAWADAQTAALKKLGAKNPGSRVRIGEQYPSYVQNNGMEGDEFNLIDAELPGSALSLASMFLYLSIDGKAFAQEMQMT